MKKILLLWVTLFTALSGFITGCATDDSSPVSFVYDSGNLVYIEADNGENYIYDRSAKNCVAVRDVLFEYLPHAEGT